MIEPNDESYQPGRELGPEEQKWLRNERDEQEWLREQQHIFPQQVSNIAAAPATWRLREAPEEEHGLSEVNASGAGVRSEGKQLQRSSFFCLLPGQHRACGEEEGGYGASQERPGRAPVEVCVARQRYTRVKNPASTLEVFLLPPV